MALIYVACQRNIAIGKGLVRQKCAGYGMIVVTLPWRTEA